jgi:6-pyruvoyltetrahydropterin/6-carboxytetrahydropterin synthase
MNPMRFSIGKRFAFSASHQLPDLPEDHKCARLHGHNYVVEVVVAATDLVAPGFVTDFGDLEPLRSYLDETFDHRHLNDVLAVPATSENLAAHIAAWFLEHLQPRISGQLIRVRVSETGTTWAEYTVDAAA